MIFVVLGHQPGLSLTELSALLGRDIDFSRSSKEIAILEGDENDLQIIRGKAGGVIKAGHIIGELETWDADDVASLLASQVIANQTDGKISYGISVYSLYNQNLAHDILSGLSPLGLTIKRLLKEQGRSARYVTSREPVLSSVVVATNHLLESGGEWVIIPSPDRIFIGQTAFVQDFHTWSERDYGRPARDAKSGMLPPKLARLMVNLAGAPADDATLFDPFCGSGTVLMEAALLGFSHIIGSDISEKAVRDTEKNMKWLSQEMGTHPELTLFTSPAQTLPDTMDNTVDILVAETYLGPAMSGAWHAAAIDKTIQTLQTLNTEAFTRLYRILKPGGRAVIAFPAYHTKTGYKYLSMAERLQKIGFTLRDPIPATTPLKLREVTPDGGILYSRPEQQVARELMVLEKPRE